MDARRIKLGGHALTMSLLLLAALHAYWALGGRWGRDVVLGGGSAAPPAAAVWVVVAALVAAALVVLGRVGLWGRSLPVWIFGSGTWVLCTMLAAAALINLSTRRPLEMLLIAPFCLLLAALAAVVARSGGGSDPEEGR